MASRTIVNHTDDIDGSPADSYVGTTFALDGVEYEIDLSDDNYERLCDGLKDFVANARRIGGRRRVHSVNGHRKAATTDPAQTAAIREWARKNGWPDLSNRGRIAADVLEAFERAHEEPKPAKGARGRGKKVA